MICIRYVVLLGIYLGSWGEAADIGLSMRTDELEAALGQLSRTVLDSAPATPINRPEFRHDLDLLFAHFLEDVPAQSPLRTLAPDRYLPVDRRTRALWFMPRCGSTGLGRPRADTPADPVDFVAGLLATESVQKWRFAAVLMALMCEKRAGTGVLQPMLLQLMNHTMGQYADQFAPLYRHILRGLPKQSKSSTDFGLLDLFYDKAIVNSVMNPELCPQLSSELFACWRELISCSPLSALKSVTERASLSLPSLAWSVLFFDATVRQFKAKQTWFSVRKDPVRILTTCGVPNRCIPDLLIHLALRGRTQAELLVSMWLRDFDSKDHPYRPFGRTVSRLLHERFEKELHTGNIPIARILSHLNDRECDSMLSHLLDLDKTMNEHDINWMRFSGELHGHLIGRTGLQDRYENVTPKEAARIAISLGTWIIDLSDGVTPEHTGPALTAESIRSLLLDAANTDRLQNDLRIHIVAKAWPVLAPAVPDLLQSVVAHPRWPKSFSGYRVLDLAVDWAVRENRDNMDIQRLQLMTVLMEKIEDHDEMRDLIHSLHAKLPIVAQMKLILQYPDHLSMDNPKKLSIANSSGPNTDLLLERFSDNCPICLSALTPSKTDISKGGSSSISKGALKSLTLMPCRQHVLHRRCSNKYRRSHSQSEKVPPCPICRQCSAN